MAWNFAAQIHALTGFDADDGDTATETGDTFSVLANQWLIDAAREVIHILPQKLKEKCTTETTLNHSATTVDLDTLGGEVLYVNRLSADSGGSRIPCREVPSMYGELSNDSNSLYKASATDPVYWILSSGDAAILNVIPTPTENQTAIVYHIGYPSIDNGDSAIANFPNEAEYLVVLRASLTAAEYLLAIEEETMLESIKGTQNEEKRKEAIREFYAKKEKNLKIHTAGAIAEVGTQALMDLGSAVGANDDVMQTLTIANAIASTYAGANKALEQGGAYGFVSAAAVVTAGLANVRSINQAYKEKEAQYGFEGVVDEPTQFTVGEGGASEFVSVTPMEGVDNSVGGGGSTIVIQGNVMTDDFVENELAEKIAEAVRRGTDFGIS